MRVAVDVVIFTIQSRELRVRLIKRGKGILFPF